MSQVSCYIIAVVFAILHCANCNNSTCDGLHCIDELCTDDGLCNTGCTQWYTNSNSDTESGFNCSLNIPEMDTTSEFYIKTYDDDSIKFYIEMDTRIERNVARFYSYSIEQKGSSRYQTIVSQIRHQNSQESKTENIKLNLDKNKPHWFRLRLQREQNGETSSGEPSQPAGLYISKKNKSSQKADDKVIPLVVLLTLFVTATVILGILANYLARKRLEAKERLANGETNVNMGDAASNASVISLESKGDAKIKDKYSSATPDSLRYQQRETDATKDIRNSGMTRENRSVPDCMNEEYLELQEARPTNGPLRDVSTPLTEVEDSPYARINLDESYNSTHSDLSGRNIQISFNNETRPETPTNKVAKQRRRSKTRDLPRDLSEGEKKRNSKKRKQNAEDDATMTSSQTTAHEQETFEHKQSIVQKEEDAEDFTE